MVIELRGWGRKRKTFIRKSIHSKHIKDQIPLVLVLVLVLMLIIIIFT